MTITPETRANSWSPIKKAIWAVLMDENLNDGHYISAHPLADKLVDAVLAAAPAAPAQETVAWRFRQVWQGGGLVWGYTAVKPDLSHEYVVEPLYAAPPAPVAADYVLPCDVMIAPGTIIRKGCKLSTLLAGIKGRETAPEGTCLTLTRPAPVAASAVDGLRPIADLPVGQYALLKVPGSNDTEFPGYAVGRKYADGTIWLTCGWAGSTYQGEPEGWFPLAATPSSPNPVADNPAGETIVNAPRVRELEWTDLGNGTSFRALLPIIGSVRVEPYGCCGWWEVLWSMPGMCDKLIPDVFDNPEDAKAAAQADYERRVLACLEPACISPGAKCETQQDLSITDGWRDIASAPKDGTHFLAYEPTGDMYRAAYHSDGYVSAFCGQSVTTSPEPTMWRPIADVLPPPPAAEGK